MHDETEIYSAEDVHSVIAGCGTSLTCVRDAAMIHAMWCSGIRCAEACDLLTDHIDRRRGTIWVADGKGGKSRLVVLPRPMTAALWCLLDRWQRVRPEGATLFCSLKGARLDESYVRHMFTERSASVGLGIRFHPHGLRHTFAVKMHIAGVGLEVIQKQLGHADLSVTGRYLRRISDTLARSRIDAVSLDAATAGW